MRQRKTRYSRPPAAGRGPGPGRTAVAALALLIAGCTPPTGLDTDTALPARDAPRPAGAAPGSCWHKTVTPAVLETVTETTETAPPEIAADGTVRTPAQYRTDSVVRVVEPRRIDWQEILCPASLTPGFIESLQRALQIRGFYDGAVTGVLDPTTRAAIAAYHAQEGLVGTDLSITAARRLGLQAVPRETAN